MQADCKAFPYKFQLIFPDRQTEWNCGVYDHWFQRDSSANGLGFGLGLGKVRNEGVRPVGLGWAGVWLAQWEKGVRVQTQPCPGDAEFFFIARWELRSCLVGQKPGLADLLLGLHGVLTILSHTRQDLQAVHLSCAGWPFPLKERRNARPPACITFTYIGKSADLN